jgi:transposase InsO family protein
LIEGLFNESRRTYGSPRIHAALRARGVSCGLNRVARLMRKLGLKPRMKKKFRVQTTNSNHDHPIAPNLLNQDFSTDHPNQIWVSDMTYIPTDEGWLYLSSTMDLCSRSIVGWSMSASMDADTSVIAAMKMALERRSPPRGLIHHSDQGIQYACSGFRDLLRAYGIKASMSGKGNCYDNAVKESFFHTLKTELVVHERYRTRAEARASLFDYIEVFYNRQRLHSSLGYLSPADFEAAAA